MSLKLEEKVPIMETNNNKGLNLKATELRLGLPGSESPERDTPTIDKDNKNVYSIKNCLVTSGAKRVFSDTINGGSGKWVFSGNAGSDADLVQNGTLFSPRGGAKILGAGAAAAAAESGVVKEAVTPAPEKKNQASGVNGQRVPPPAAK